VRSSPQGPRLGPALMLLATLLASTSVAAQTVEVLSPSSVTRGSTFSVNVQVKSVNDLYGLQFGLSFNPGVVEALGVSEGSFLKQGGASTFWNPPAIDNAVGMVSGAAATRLGPIPGVSGSGTLATISFRAKAAGSSSLTLTGVSLSDASAQPIPHTTVGGWVSVSPPPVPPDTQITAGPTGTIASTNATFKWTGWDTDGSVVSYQHKVDNQQWVTTSQTSHTITGLFKGSHIFYVRAKDNHGLVDPTPASRSFEVYYTVNPDTHILSGPNGTVEGNTATFEWIGMDMDGEITNYLYSLDGGPVNQTEGTIATYSNLSHGRHTFSVRAVDDDGLEDPTPAKANFTLVPYWWEKVIEGLSQNVSILQQDLGEAIANLREKMEQSNALEEEKHKLESMLSGMQANMAILASQKDDLQSQVDSLELERASLMTAAEELEELTDRLGEEALELEEELIYLEGQLQVARNDTAALTLQADRTRTELRRKEAELWEVREVMNSTLGEKAQLESNLLALEGTALKLGQQVDKLQANISALTREREVRNGEVRSLQGDMDLLRKRISDLQSELREAEARLSEKLDEIGDVEGEKEALQTELRTVGDQNSSLKAALMALVLAISAVTLMLLGVAIKSRRRAPQDGV
jgi:predicted  nucleic acid-binding Zn-ribbon protein